MLICQLTDLHVRLRGIAANRVSETNMFTERAFKAVAGLTPTPDLILLTGDLTESGKPAEYQNLVAILRRTLHRKLYAIPGNHDNRETMRAELAGWPGIVAHADYIQYAIEDYPVRVIMLDTLVEGFSYGELGADRLAWLEETLGAQPERPTLIAMHHPPFVTAIPHMDRIALRDADAFTALVARHRQVQRIICGHHHRPIFGTCAHAVVSISPSIAHQVVWTLDAEDEGALNFEPPAFHLHLWQPSHGIVSHTLYVDSFPGPFPFLSA